MTDNNDGITRSMERRIREIIREELRGIVSLARCQKGDTPLRKIMNTIDTLKESEDRQTDG